MIACHKLPKDGEQGFLGSLTKGSADSGDSIEGLSRGHAGPRGGAVVLVCHITPHRCSSCRTEVTHLDLALYLGGNPTWMEPFPKAACRPVSEAGHSRQANTQRYLRAWLGRDSFVTVEVLL